jgi:hypothetical protein
MAAVRIAMTVGIRGQHPGVLFRVVDPQRPAARGGDELRNSEKGLISSSITIDIDVNDAKTLTANRALATRGAALHGSGFIISRLKAEDLGLGSVPGLEKHIRQFRNGKDLTSRNRNIYVIDLNGLREEQVRSLYPLVYQHVLMNVKPERDQNNEKYRRENWWLFGRTNALLREVLDGLPRYIVTVATARRRVFQFLNEEILPGDMLVAIALEDPFFLGVLSSRVHQVWALAAGSRLGVGNDSRYLQSRCFEPFAVPDGTMCDPFAGSGALVKAAAAAGMEAIGIEKNPVDVRAA